jgi:hypothetical protein
LSVKKIKQSRYRPEQPQRVDRGIALLFRDFGKIKGCVVSITSRQFYSRERSDTDFTGGLVEPRAGLDV